ncbi:uracil-DNA glycosylase [Thalassospira xianhensis]|uniref:uracil-DNA glycosylase n=1 Tax=Thalassospira xianhensis TaxID=478503 RepID=UPI000DEDA9DF|nr:uracil-DNA glycosylase [Thalassospira xianhensis]
MHADQLDAQNIPAGWRSALSGEFSKPYMASLRSLLHAEAVACNILYPAASDIFRALELTSLEDVKVVIIGQDPYHGPGQAHGLSFSVQRGQKIPPSLRNIYTELQDDIGVTPPRHGFLEEWAQRGVLLLNTSLTVRTKSPGSHSKWGWDQFTTAIVQAVSNRPSPAVFILWGQHAQQLSVHIDAQKNPVIASAHPSPFAARKGFFGSRPFSTANQFLLNEGISPVNWAISE